MAYSNKIDVPKFQEYIKNSKKYQNPMMFGIFFITIMGFYLYGKFSNDIDNSEAIRIGLTTGGVLLFLGLIRDFRQGRGKIWDATVINKEAKKVRYKERVDEDSYVTRTRIVYILNLRSKQGRRSKITQVDKDSFDYLNVGDKVRYHSALGTFEKFDKLKDEFIFCNACQ